MGPSFFPTAPSQLLVLPPSLWSQFCQVCRVDADPGGDRKTRWKDAVRFYPAAQAGPAVPSRSPVQSGRSLSFGGVAAAVCLPQRVVCGLAMDSSVPKKPWLPLEPRCQSSPLQPRARRESAFL